MAFPSAAGQPLRHSSPQDTDRYGLPVAHFSHSMCDNDRALLKAATSIKEEMHRAAGAEEAITIERYAHLIGGCRMAVHAANGEEDATCTRLPFRTSSSSTAACAQPRAAQIRP
jgi:hypothetical protein